MRSGRSGEAAPSPSPLLVRAVVLPRHPRSRSALASIGVGLDPGAGRPIPTSLATTGGGSCLYRRYLNNLHLNLCSGIGDSASNIAHRERPWPAARRSWGSISAAPRHPSSPSPLTSPCSVLAWSGTTCRIIVGQRPHLLLPRHHRLPRAWWEPDLGFLWWRRMTAQTSGEPNSGWV